MQTVKEINSFFQRKEPQSECEAENQAHPVLPALSIVLDLSIKIVKSEEEKKSIIIFLYSLENFTHSLCTLRVKLY